MKPRNIRRIVAPVAFGLLSCVVIPAFGQDNHEAQEKKIAMSEVPQAARDAAQKALGRKPTEAKMVQGTSPQEYELEAKMKGGKEMAVHVTADGTVTKHESESAAEEHAEHGHQ